MIINQTTAGPTKYKLEQADNYKYGRQQLKQRIVELIKRRIVNLIKQLKRMGFKEEILINIYRSITLSQYLYTTSRISKYSSKKRNGKQQHRFFNIIGITSARVLEVYKIEPIATFLDHQCVIT
jgi:hypothetical protein